jgi:Flp pilus assembly pilin Flp
VQRMLLLSTTVSYIRTRFADLRAREDGVTAVEYALMVAIIALLMVAGFFLLFDNIRTAFDNTGACVTAGEAALDEGCDPVGGG